MRFHTLVLSYINIMVQFNILERLAYTKQVVANS